MRWVWLITGWAATALGALGVVLPLLPTTPFLLLAAACFARSSPKARRWLLSSPVLGPVLNDYLVHRSVPRHAKFVALALLWPGVGWAATRVIQAPAAGGALVLLAAGISFYLLSLPSRPATR